VSIRATGGERTATFAKRLSFVAQPLLMQLDSFSGWRRIAAMRWETPSFVEINMSAEIGGYGSDFSDRDPMDPAVEPAQADRAPATDSARR